jgi:hypothetical protein
LADNGRTSQRNDEVTTRHFISSSRGADIEQIQDMNLTLTSTPQATGATTTALTDNVTLSLEHYMDVKLNQDFGNISLALSKVKYVIHQGSRFIKLAIYITDYLWLNIKGSCEYNETDVRRGGN